MPSACMVAAMAADCQYGHAGFASGFGLGLDFDLASGFGRGFVADSLTSKRTRLGERRAAIAAVVEVTDQPAASKLDAAGTADLSTEGTDRKVAAEDYKHIDHCYRTEKEKPVDHTIAGHKPANPGTGEK